MNPDNNISQEEFEYIDRYLSKTMTFEERASFEEKLNTNPDFKIQVEDIKTILSGIESQVLKEKLEEFHKDLPIQKETISTGTKIRFLHFRKIAIAVAAIFVVALGSFWFLNQSLNASFYKTYYSPDPGLPTTMSTTEDFTFYDAMVNYKRENYTQALNKWEPLLENKPENDTLNYFIGSAYLASGKVNEAIPFLEKTASQPKSIFLKDAHFYLGLAYLQKDDLVNAKNYLRLSHLEKSKELLKKLNEK